MDIGDPRFENFVQCKTIWNNIRHHFKESLDKDKALEQCLKMVNEAHEDGFITVDQRDNMLSAIPMWNASLTEEEFWEIANKLYKKGEFPHDLRYAPSQVDFYTDVICHKYPDADQETVGKYVGEMMSKFLKWHEENRWDFKPHKDILRNPLPKEVQHGVG